MLELLPLRQDPRFQVVLADETVRPPGFGPPGNCELRDADLSLSGYLPFHTEYGISTWPLIKARAVRRIPERVTLKSVPEPETSSVTVNSPLGCSTDIMSGDPVGLFTMPSATDPGSTHAVATLTAPSTPMAAWHLCGMKVRVHT
jgi:hypothetical protein